MQQIFTLNNIKIILGEEYEQNKFFRNFSS